MPHDATLFIRRRPRVVGSAVDDERDDADDQAHDGGTGGDDRGPHRSERDLTPVGGGVSHRDQFLRAAVLISAPYPSDLQQRHLGQRTLIAGHRLHEVDHLLGERERVVLVESHGAIVR